MSYTGYLCPCLLHLFKREIVIEPIQSDGFFHPCDRISMELPILYFMGSQVKISKLECVYVLKIVFVVANTVYPNKMLPYAAFHLGLHCVAKYLFTGIQNEKG